MKWNLKEEYTILNWAVNLSFEVENLNEVKIQTMNFVGNRPFTLSCNYQIVNPLSHNIQKQILPTDLYTFP